MVNLFVCLIIVAFFVSTIYFNCNISYSSKAKMIKKITKERKNNISLIIISFFKLTSSQFKRILNVGVGLDSSYSLALVTENCNYTQKLKPYKVFCFTQDNFKIKFPLYKNMKGVCYNKSIKFYMWSMCLENILHSVEFIYLEYKFIWIMEADLGYSGNINFFFKKYDKSYSDLLSLPRRVSYNVSQWGWYDCYSEEYMKWIKSKTLSKRIHSYINIVRISPILLNHVLTFYKLNRHSHCESTLHEIALYNNLIITYIDSNDIGEKNEVYHRVSEKEWKFFNSYKAKKNKLYHALKF